MVRPLILKRIALFTGAYNHIADGVSLTLNRLVGYLERQNTPVRVFAPTVKQPALQHRGTLVPAPSFPIPGRGEYRVTTGLSNSIRRELDRFQPTVVHIATPDVLGYQAMKWAKANDIPVVSSYHTHFSSYLKYYKLGILENRLWNYLRWFYGECEQVYVPSQSMADVLAGHGIKKNIMLWQRGIETQRFHPDHRDMEWRRAHGFGDDEVVISFISRLVWEKGLDVYADVLEGLRQRGIPFRGLVVGEGPAREALQKRLPDTLFLGHQSGEDLAKAYAASDIFLFPSETETFGNVTLEAMASGVPTVCADATGSRSLVADGVTGYLAQPQNTAEFLEHVQQLAVNAPKRRYMGHQARERAMAYDWDIILDRLVGYYDKLLYNRALFGEIEEPTMAEVA